MVTANSVISRLVKAHFVATEQDVQQLAASVQMGSEANGAYLQVLLVECQSKLGPVKAVVVRGRRQPPPPTAEAMAQVLDTAHQRFYPYILLGVGSPDTDKAELARRATFARTAKTTLMNAVRAGVDLRLLDPMSITKRELRRLTQAAGSAPPGEEDGGGGEEGDDQGAAADVVKTVQRGERMLLNALTILAARDRRAAVLAVGRIVEELDRIVSLEEAAEATQVHASGTIVGHQLERRT